MRKATASAPRAAWQGTSPLRAVEQIPWCSPHTTQRSELSLWDPGLQTATSHCTRAERKFHRPKDWLQFPRTPQPPNNTKMQELQGSFGLQNNLNTASMLALHPKIKLLFTRCVGACSEDSLGLYNTGEHISEQQGPNLTKMFFLPGNSHGPTGWELQAGSDTLDLLVVIAINAF